MTTPLHGPAADRSLAGLDPETAAHCPPRPTGYYDDYETVPPVTRWVPALPPRPDNATPEQLREWKENWWVLRNFLGSGN